MGEEVDDDTWDELYDLSVGHSLIVENFIAAAVALHVPISQAKRIWREELAKQPRGPRECDWIAVVELSVERLKRLQ